MKRLRWFDYLTINLFWLGLNIRNRPWFDLYALHGWNFCTRGTEEYSLGSDAIGRPGHRHAGPTGCRAFE